MSLFISCIPLAQGSTGKPTALSGHFLSCGILGSARFLREDRFERLSRSLARGSNHPLACIAQPFEVVPGRQKPCDSPRSPDSEGRQNTEGRKSERKRQREKQGRRGQSPPHLELIGKGAGEGAARQCLRAKLPCCAALISEPPLWYFMKTYGQGESPRPASLPLCLSSSVSGLA
ncbi:hypothetical protein KOW79_021184 [Hemibagrus wyckioides]|uniref:Uncharacterized protein n=1 Tax=Hemibagrus wyckioides TaxID=337641 RepID=A0A9D3S8D3_9TELE|nr:hypothetical protein KOW79_021184 [Hemibagrus wyckioides]